MLNKIREDYEEILMLAVGIICATLNVHIYGVFPILLGCSCSREDFTAVMSDGRTATRRAARRSSSRSL